MLTSSSPSNEASSPTTLLTLMTLKPELKIVIVPEALSVNVISFALAMFMANEAMATANERTHLFNLHIFRPLLDACTLKPRFAPQR